MSDQSKVCPTKKQQDNEPPHKRQKTETEAVAESSSIQTKLTDVNIDCLESVFMHLSFDDLLNIAHTNKELKPAIDLTFARKFGKTLFVLCIKKGQRKNTNVQIDKNSIKIKDLQTALRTVRCFGHLITKLNVSFGCHLSQHQYRLWSEKLIHYASTYCSESLDRIVFNRISSDGFKGLEKPFVKTEDVKFAACMLGSKITPLNTLFPNVTILQFYHVKAAPECIELHFPQLQQLEIKGPIPTPTIEDTMGILRLNTQLQALVLDTNCTTNLLRCVNENLHQLERFEVRCSDKDFLDFGDDVIKFEQLTKLTILFGGNGKIPKIPILCRQLNEFTWKSSDYVSIMDKKFTNFLKKHPSINKLKIMYYRGQVRSIYGDISIIAELLPMLQELKFDNISILNETVVSFVCQCMLLKTLRFNIDNFEDFDRLVAQLDSQWKASIDAQDQVTLEREF